MARLFSAIFVFYLCGFPSSQTSPVASSVSSAAQTSAPAAPAPPSVVPAGLRLVRSPKRDRWLDIIAEYARDAAGDHADLLRAPFPLNLPVGGSRGKPGATLPVLVVPLPVPYRSADKTKCTEDSSEEDYKDEYVSPQKHGGSRVTQRRKPAKATSYQDDSDSDSDSDESYEPSTRRPANRRRPSSNKQKSRYIDDEEVEYKQVVKEKRPTKSGHFKITQVRPKLVDEPYNEVEELPTIAVTSDILLEKFREQAPVNPELPPALIEGYGQLESYPSASEASAVNHDRYEAAPPRPVFDKSLLLKGEITVHRADYTEPFTAMWDAATGAARVELHYGGTNVHRMMLPGGFVQRVERSVDRTGEGEVRRCGVTSASAASAEDRALPGLPDLTQFDFAGFRPLANGDRGESWKRIVVGPEGGARGEVLTTSHEMILTRKGGQTVPVTYKVKVDSSVLGPNIDSYEFRYLHSSVQNHDNLDVDTNQACDVVEPLNEKNLEHMARLEPLREFTLPTRDIRYDGVISNFVREFKRSYVDNKEEAIRKNLVMQSTRFVTSCNRMSGPFHTVVNFLGDRLEAELESLRGVQADGEIEDAEPFPHSVGEARSLSGRLPKEFDWRPRGAVTPVKYQGTCASCWAFAVTGAVEGALFVRTRRLRELAEQALVDCGYRTGAHGCRGTWPARAYDYVQERGLPARDEYTSYMEKVLKCRDNEVLPVTHISAHYNVTSNSVPALKISIKHHAPTVVVVDAKANSFKFYSKGVLYDDRCIKGPERSLNHAVLAVGWGEKDGAPHFIIKNSWSAAWGDGGYIRLQGPANTCGVLTVPSVPRLERPDVDRTDLIDAAGQTDVEE